MNSNLKNILIVLNTLALGASALWIIKTPDFEPIISTLVLLASLVGLWIAEPKDKKKLQQQQKGGNNSNNIQAGRDIKIKNIK